MVVNYTLFNDRLTECGSFNLYLHRIDEAKLAKKTKCSFHIWVTTFKQYIVIYVCVCKQNFRGCWWLWFVVQRRSRSNLLLFFFLFFSFFSSSSSHIYVFSFLVASIFCIFCMLAKIANFTDVAASVLLPLA